MKIYQIGNLRTVTKAENRETKRNLVSSNLEEITCKHW